MSSYSREAIEKGRKIAKRKNDWRKHFVVWLSISLLLIMINAFGGGGPWFQWAVIPWGIVVLMNRLLIWSDTRDDKVEAKEIKKALKRRGLAESYAEEMFEEDGYEEFDDELELDDRMDQKPEVLRPNRRWDEGDLV